MDLSNLSIADLKAIHDYADEMVECLTGGTVDISQADEERITFWVNCDEMVQEELVKRIK